MKISKEEAQLEKNWLLSTPVETFEVVRPNGRLMIQKGEVYLFSHPGLEKPAKIDDYWKGCVEDIRALPSQTDALVQVRWFFAKKDVKDSLGEREIPGNLRSALNAMANNELYPGSEIVLNSSDAIESDVDVVGLTDDEDQEPVVDYFYRFAWDEKKKAIHGNPSCGKKRCSRMWNPDKEEQRYCYGCKKWYHTSCLSVIKKRSQTNVVDEALVKLDRAIPTILLQLAFQPTARGGARHFTAGNIRIVNFARHLVENSHNMLEFCGGKQWDGDAWVSALKDYFGIEDEDDGDIEREQLVVGCQDIYRCVTCNGQSSI